MRRVAAGCVLLWAVGCAQTLPEHDNRIFTAVPTAKLSVADLVQAYTDNAVGASARFDGRAVEVSGLVPALPVPPTSAFLLTSGDAAQRVRVSFHEDQADESLKTLDVGRRITLRCFCEGLTDLVTLKSCVIP